MSVELRYLGRLGNHLFIYACGRLFAKENNLFLKTPLIPNEILEATPREGGEAALGPQVELRDGEDLFSRKYPRANYLLNGYWQCGRWYMERRDAILSFLKPKRSFPRNSQDIAIHLRLTDFKKYKIAVHPSWYLSILKDEKFRKLYIVTDEIDVKYLSAFRQYDAFVAHGTISEDWNLLRSFDRLILSPSTFAWWAGFFSDAKRIYFFKRYQNGTEMETLPNSQVVDGPLLHEAPL